MSNVTEFAPGLESVTATIDMENNFGDRLAGPIHIGYYTGDDCTELFLEQEGRRISFEAEDIPKLVKQIKRAQRIQEEQK